MHGGQSLATKSSRFTANVEEGVLPQQQQQYKRGRAGELLALSITRKVGNATHAGGTAADNVKCNKQGEKRQTRNYTGN